MATTKKATPKKSATKKAGAKKAGTKKAVTKKGAAKKAVTKKAAAPVQEAFDVREAPLPKGVAFMGHVPIGDIVEVKGFNPRTVLGDLTELKDRKSVV